MKESHSVPQKLEHLEIGKALRERTPRSAHADWHARQDRREAIALLAASNRGRVPALIPVRYGRMLVSPFAFLRGGALHGERG